MNLLLPAVFAAALSPLVPAQEPALQVDWVQSPMNGQWYGVDYTPRSWLESEALAVSLGGHLATVRNQAEQTWLESNLQSWWLDLGLWVGLNDLVTEGAFEWVSGDPSTYRNWSFGMPDDFNGGEDAVHMVGPAFSSDHWEWNDGDAASLIRPLFEVSNRPGQGWSWPRPTQVGAGPEYPVTASDIDDDGIPDLVAACRGSNEVHVLYGDGLGGSAVVAIVSGVPQPFRGVTADFDLDGLSDLAVICYDGKARIYRGLNSRSFEVSPSSVIEAGGANAAGIVTADFNGDQLPDLALAPSGSAPTKVLFGTGTMNFTESLVPVSADGTRFLQVLAGGQAEPSMLIVVPTRGADGIQIVSFPGSKPMVVDLIPRSQLPERTFTPAVGDVNADGLLDLLVPCVDAFQVRLFPGEGTGQFADTPTQVIGTGMEGHELALIDHDADGDPDLFVAEWELDRIHLFLNEAGQFSSASQFATGDEPVAIASADFNADGSPDFAIVERGAGRVSIYLNQVFPDCNQNGIPDVDDIVGGAEMDCNSNGTPDSCDLAILDCNQNGVVDTCELSSANDCDGNGLIDLCEIATNAALDSNSNGILDVCDNPGSPYCFGDGTGFFCPCLAHGNAGEGCANSSGVGGATLIGSGQAALTGDTFQLSVIGVPGSKPGLILRGAMQVNGGLGNVVGDGLLCTGGQTARSQVQVTSGGDTTFTNFQGQPFGQSSFGIGVPTSYQCWYRDPANTCSGSGFNFSNGWTVSWLP